jgi:hypothetical protein
LPRTAWYINLIFDASSGRIKLREKGAGRGPGKNMFRHGTSFLHGDRAGSVD